MEKKIISFFIYGIYFYFLWIFSKISQILLFLRKIQMFSKTLDFASGSMVFNGNCKYELIWPMGSWLKASVHDGTSIPATWSWNKKLSRIGQIEGNIWHFEEDIDKISIDDILSISPSKCHISPSIWPILDNFWFQFQVAGTEVLSCTEA